ncbi:hypothetical protein APHAL10511_006852 [Amanita phalloides]|nr:hypothetical protein APHAL10511_006852 [Amanita phalloides]
MVVPRKRKHSHNDLHAPLSSTDTGCKGEKQPQVEERRRSVRLRGRGTTIGPTDDTRNELLEGVAPGSDCSGGKVPQSKKRGRSLHARKTGTIAGTTNNTPSECLNTVAPNFDNEGEEEPQSQKRGCSTPARRRGTITGTANNTRSQRPKCVVPTSSKENKAKTAEGGTSACSEFIQQLFKLKPNRYPEGKGQGSTRPPAFYDMHMKDDLLLKKVVFCPDLVSRLGNIAERAVGNYEATPGTTPFESVFDVGNIRRKLECQLLNGMTEGDVVKAYATIAGYIMPIVSAVTFQDAVKWEAEMISWADCIKQDRAIADAAVIVKNSIRTHECPCQNSKDPQKQPAPICAAVAMCQSLFEYFPRTLLFEFKSPRAGSHRHMVSMLRTSSYDIFPWTGCDDERCSSDCGEKRGIGLGTQIPVTGNRMGFDAENPVIRVTDSSITGERSIERNWSKGGKESLAGRWILQQGWAECVKNDSTFIVFNSGAREIIGYRCRKDQILYISDIIDIQKQPKGSPGYFQLHIGLYIASLVDAMDRVEQLKYKVPASWLTPWDKDDVLQVNILSCPNFDEALSNYPKLMLQPSQAKHRGNTYYIQDKSYKRANSGDERLLIKTDITHDSTVYHGTLIISETIYEKKIIVKIAVDQKTYDTLSNEYDIYTKLQDMPGIPLVYGRFVEHSEPLRPGAALLMQYAGEPVGQNAIPYRQKQIIVDILARIHLRGYLHGNLSEKCILILREGNQQSPYIVGFDKVRRIRTPDEAEGEMENLKNILRHIVKRRRTERSEILFSGIAQSDNQEAFKLFRKCTAWMATTKEHIFRKFNV